MSDEGEEWKGETPGGFFSAFSLGPWRALTPEEAAKHAEERARLMAGGNLAYEALGAFAVSRHCPKCDSRDTAKVRYIMPGADETKLGEHDALQRTCKRCRYQWYERTEDA